MKLISSEMNLHIDTNSLDLQFWFFIFDHAVRKLTFNIVEVEQYQLCYPLCLGQIEEEGNRSESPIRCYLIPPSE